MTRELNSNVITLMRDKGWLRTEGFALRVGFAGVFEVKNVREYKSVNDNTAGKIDNFTLECKAPNGLANLSGYQISNARIIDMSKIDKEPVEGKPDIFYRDEIQDIIANSVPFHTKFEDDETFAFEETLYVVGAMVTRDEETKKPLIPLRRYKYYNQIVNHHRLEMGDDEAFVSRQEFRDYLAGSAKIAGIPEDQKKMTLSGTTKADDESAWSFILLIADTKEK